MTTDIETAEKQIRKLTTLFNAHLQKENNNIVELLEEVKALREEVKPVLEMYVNSRGFLKLLTAGLQLAALLGAGIAALIYLKKTFS